MSATVGVSGTTQGGFEHLRSVFENLLREDPHYGAELSVYHHGEKVADLWGGKDARANVVHPVYSSTKGAAAFVVATLVDEGLLNLDTTVARYWPQFAAEDKGNVTVRQLLSHQAGLVSAEGLTASDILDSESAARKLAAARPAWRPGAAVGYHGLTIGVLMEELVRRVSSVSLQSLYESRIRASRGIDFYLGLPAMEDARFSKPGPAALPTSDAQSDPPLFDDLAAFTFSSMHRPFDPNAGDLDFDRTEVRTAGFAAGGGVGSADGLARLYSAALGDIGTPFVRPSTMRDFAQTQVWGRDLVLSAWRSFGIVFATPNPDDPFGSHEAFGHPGAGGSMAFADPLYGLAFGYIPTPDDPFEEGARRVRTLSEAARRCARNAGQL